MLAHVAEVDARKLYVPAGYSSMHVYCVEELGFSDETAYKRIRVARKARRFPSIFPALADGRLNLSSVVLLAPYLVESTVDLIEAAEHKKNCEIQALLAERFPLPDLPTRLEIVGTASPSTMPGLELAVRAVADPASGEPGAQLDESIAACKQQAGSVDEPASRQSESQQTQIVQSLSCQLAVRPVAASTPRSRVAPIAPDRVALQVTMSQSTADKLQYARELLGHRCTSRTGIEFDHVQEVARGGRATVANVRLLCKAHNQCAAECAFGADFMSNKRQEAKAALIRRG